MPGDRLVFCEWIRSGKCCSSGLYYACKWPWFVWENFLITEHDRALFKSNCGPRMTWLEMYTWLIWWPEVEVWLETHHVPVVSRLQLSMQWFPMVYVDSPNPRITISLICAVDPTWFAIAILILSLWYGICIQLLPTLNLITACFISKCLGSTMMRVILWLCHKMTEVFENFISISTATQCMHTQFKIDIVHQDMAFFISASVSILFFILGLSRIYFSKQLHFVNKIEQKAHQVQGGGISRCWLLLRLQACLHSTSVCLVNLSKHMDWQPRIYLGKISLVLCHFFLFLVLTDFYCPCQTLMA